MDGILYCRRKQKRLLQLYAKLKIHRIIYNLYYFLRQPSVVVNADVLVSARTFKCEIGFTE